MSRIHYLAEYLRQPVHPISVQLVGLGGTGSNVLRGLAFMNQALIGMGQMGLMVTAFDPDFVSDTNTKRQLFYKADVGESKAQVLISRYNRSFGTHWRSHQCTYEKSFMSSCMCNILLTCVDTGIARKNIAKHLDTIPTSKKCEPFDQRFYWMDFGNSRDSGQIILGSEKIPQPKEEEGYPKSIAKLKNVVELYPDIDKFDITEEQGPSCSTQQALNRQDLFINTTIADLGLMLLWQLLRNFNTPFQGIFFNGKTFQSNPMTIQ